MRPGEDEFGLRLAAKAEDRERAARQEWPAFEERLRQLGYGPRAIAHAFCTLSGPGTVAEALEVLRTPMPESHPVALSFEVTETRGGASTADLVTITAVERDASVIRVNYDTKSASRFRIDPRSGGSTRSGRVSDEVGLRTLGSVASASVKSAVRPSAGGWAFATRRAIRAEQNCEYGCREACPDMQAGLLPARGHAGTSCRKTKVRAARGRRAVTAYQCVPACFFHRSSCSSHVGGSPGSGVG
jgi:hypothetical protein